MVVGPPTPAIPQRGAHVIAGTLVGLILLGCLPMNATIAAVPETPPHEQSIRESIRQRVEWLVFGYGDSVAGEQLPSLALTAELYASSRYQPLWRDRDRIEQLWEVAALAQAQGLSTDDYPLAAIRALLPRSGLPATPGHRADVDLLATDALVRMTYQIRFGKLSPQSGLAVWNFDRPLRAGEANLQTLAGLLQADSLAERLSWLFDRGSRYRRWVVLLEEARRLEAAGGWPAVTEGPTLQLGDRGARVLEVRRRLAVTLPTARTANIPKDVYGPTLEETVRTFQNRHGLAIDGIVGPKTLAALNVSVTDRIGQVRATLERARWVLDDFRRQPESLVLINIAAARAQLLQSSETVWSSRVIIGRPDRQTPTFRDAIDYLVINPSWIVPPTILEKDILPAVRREGTTYLESRHLEVLDGEGNPVDPQTVDWSARRAEDLAHSIRQRPGPWNMLGRIKFVFPNTHFVFMHDTPTPQLFGQTCRALSSGCVRVEAPYRLAELLLSDPDRWDPESLEAIVASGKTEVVHLPHPVPIVLLYATADVDDEGNGLFYEDVYGLDVPLLAGLDAPSG